MGSLIGILSTVILVSTVCTLVFAVGAYVLSRQSREGVNLVETGGELPGEDKLKDQFPHSRDEAASAKDAGLFKRMKPQTGGEAATDEADDEYQWK